MEEIINHTNLLLTGVNRVGSKEFKGRKKKEVDRYWIFGTDYKFLLDGFLDIGRIDAINQLLQQNYKESADRAMAIMPGFQTMVFTETK
ncbi:MAG: hypothetical protein ACTHOF_18190 [Flavisolibacter sp.]